MKEILQQKAVRIKLLITDCDGVLTDGGVYYGDQGEDLKKFNIRDGMGVERLRKLAGVETAIITGEKSPSLVNRAKKLQIEELHLFIKDKVSVLDSLIRKYDLSAEEVAYIGDDYNDAAVMKLVGLTACPADALPGIKAIADYTCQTKGGDGSFREFAELIIEAKTSYVQLSSAKTGVITLSNGRRIGKGEKCYVIAEIGINHNGSLEIAKQLIDEAVAANVDAVKFQKRTPEICVPKDQWEVMRDTPWGRMSYIDYKRKTEFGIAEYATIDQYCKKVGIDWFVSAWDVPSVDFMEQFDTVMYKLASASLTDFALIQRILETGRPLMLSTGMSTMKEIEAALVFINQFDANYPLFVAHSTSAYPCRPEELNLKMIETLINKLPGIPIGYSGHETGLGTTVGAVAMGATFVERHFTLDRAMWGSDHAASVEPQGFQRLVRDIRDLEIAAGDGIKKVYESELAPMRRLRVNISDEFIEKSQLN
ncbi:N-acetylneuraminate synthase family protein [Mucilaginibacter ximonensis]|uniref:N-acetylneuraminate synthase family protein n=1 Tax=Mucilaginibacter ximonensis TaxID=538021 RepID=A0ABW5YCS2_9SPHI